MTSIRRIPTTGAPDEYNSSTTLLTNGENFTGKWMDVGDFDSIVLAVKTDQNGYYEIQFSPDAINADSTLTRYYRTGQIEAPHRFTITRKFYRVRFFNDSGSDQTYFRLQSIVGDISELNAPLDSTLAQDFDATAVRGSDFHAEVALGLRQGWSTWNKFGYNNDVDSAAPEVVASFGTNWAPNTSGGELLSIVSSSTADDLGSTGAELLLLVGIDENYEVVEEYITMDGTTPVTSTNQFIGINRGYAVQFGSGGENVGTISITGNTSGDDYAEIPAQNNVTQQCIFYTPIGYSFLSEWIWLNIRKLSGGGGSPRATVYGYSYSFVTGGRYEVFRANVDTNNDNVIDISPPLPFPVQGRECFYLVLDTDTNNTAITARFSGELVKLAST